MMQQPALPLEAEVQQRNLIILRRIDHTTFSCAMLISELTRDGPHVDFANRWVKIGFPIE